MAASATELVERPSLGTAIRSLLRHPGLIPKSLWTAIRFVGAAIRDPMSAMAEIDREMAEALDEASLSRVREFAQRAKLEGDMDTAQNLERLPAGIEALHRRFSSSLDKAYALDVFDLLTAVATAESEAAARRIVRRQIRLALHSEFLPVLMQVRGFCNQPPDPLPHVDTFCALILNEVRETLAEMAPQAVGVGGVCTALRLADSPQALEKCLSRYEFLVNNSFFEEMEHMSQSAEERGLSEFADQTRLLADMIRHHVSVFDEGLGSLTLDAQTLALLQVSFADTEEEAWAVVEEEPGLLSDTAIRQIRTQATFLQMQGEPAHATRLRQVADWLAHWRSELADPERNVVSRLADRVEAGEVTLDTALAELEKPGALTALSGPHLGAVDERVIELRVRDLRKAETLAVLNDAVARQVGGAKARAYAAISLAEVKISRGAAREALQALQDAIEHAREAADPRLELRILGAQAMAYQQLGQFREAAASYQNAQDLVRQIGSEADQMPCLGNLAHIYSVLGDMEQAFACAQEGYELARRLGDRHSQATFLGTMAILSDRTGQFPKAVEQLEQAIKVFRDLGDKSSEAKAMGNLGSVFIALGKLQQARDSINASLALAQEMGLWSVEMSNWSRLGDVELMESHLQRAIEHVQRARAVAVEIGDQSADAQTLNNLGVIWDGSLGCDIDEIFAGRILTKGRL